VSEDQALAGTNPKKLSTGEIWLKALTSLRTKSYQKIIDQPNASLGKGLYWLFLAGGFGGLFAGLVQTAFNSDVFFGMVRLGMSEEFSSNGIIWSFLGAIVFALGLPLVTLVNAALVKIIARMFGGKTDFSRLVYAFAAYQAPLGLLICIIGGIPTLGCLGAPLVVYWFILGIVVTRSACKLGVGKALLCNLAPFLIAGLLGICLIVVLFGSSINIV